MTLDQAAKMGLLGVWATSSVEAYACKADAKIFEHLMSAYRVQSDLKELQNSNEWAGSDNSTWNLI